MMRAFCRLVEIAGPPLRWAALGLGRKSRMPHPRSRTATRSRQKAWEVQTTIVGQSDRDGTSLRFGGEWGRGVFESQGSARQGSAPLGCMTKARWALGGDATNLTQVEETCLLCSLCRAENISHHQKTSISPKNGATLYVPKSPTNSSGRQMVFENGRAHWDYPCIAVNDGLKKKTMCFVTLKAKTRSRLPKNYKDRLPNAVIEQEYLESNRGGGTKTETLI